MRESLCLESTPVTFRFAYSVVRVLKTNHREHGGHRKYNTDEQKLVMMERNRPDKATAAPSQARGSQTRHLARIFTVDNRHSGELNSLRRVSTRIGQREFPEKHVRCSSWGEYYCPARPNDQAKTKSLSEKETPQELR